MRQSRIISLVEAVANVAVGFAVAIATQLVLFPVFDLDVTLQDHLLIGAAFTVVSIARSYLLRRLPLRILFFEDANGQTWATYEDPRAIAPSHGLAADHPAVMAMKGALERFSAAATGE